MRRIEKILIANRGEIARRIIKAADNLGVESIAVYAEDDKDMLFVSEANYAYCLGEGSLKETYLNATKIISLALETGADAIHPGYGFLSENASFAELCQENGVIFIGPEPSVISLMGNKIEARKAVSKLQVPVLQGQYGNASTLKEKSHSLQYPILVKAAMGGGGKGMTIVEETQALEEALESSGRQAQNYFGNDKIYIEKYLPNARHIEVQVLGDSHGNVIHLYDRECSLQRRYQKIIEEAPSPSLSSELRNEITKAAVAIAKSINYSGAGTIEFLLDKDQFYFLEMNTRIQVEHPVTEQVTHFDIVQEQILIAEGHMLGINQEDVQLRGHAIEARLYAEDPDADFQPSVGKLEHYIEPKMINLRIDGAVQENDFISPNYDPMIGKIISWGNNRQKAIDKLFNALNEFQLVGVKSNIDYLKVLLQDRNYKSNRVSTRFVEENLDWHKYEIQKLRTNNTDLALTVASVALLTEPGKNSVRNYPELKFCYANETYSTFIRELSDGFFMVEGDTHQSKVSFKQHTPNTIIANINDTEYKCWFKITKHEVYVTINGVGFVLERADTLKTVNLSATEMVDKQTRLVAPMHGRIVKILVAENQKVKAGDVLVVLESMKMENRITATHDTTVKTILVKDGQQVDPTTVMIEYGEYK